MMRLHHLATVSFDPSYLGATTHCLRCGERLVAPERTEFVDSKEIRHHWVCDACGHEFRSVLSVADGPARE